MGVSLSLGNYLVGTGIGLLVPIILFFCIWVLVVSNMDHNDPRYDFITFVFGGLWLGLVVFLLLTPILCFMHPIQFCYRIM
jgi:hypothetical protein